MYFVMKRIDLKVVSHNVKIGDNCGHIEPNITEDCIFYENGEPIGFYIKDISKYSEKAAKLANLADKELRSKNVPKSEMKRSSGLHNTEKEVLQYSTNGECGIIRTLITHIDVTNTPFNLILYGFEFALIDVFKLIE